MINWGRKVTAIVRKDNLGWTFHLKATCPEQAKEIAISRTLQEHPEILQDRGVLQIELIQ